MPSSLPWKCPWIEKREEDKVSLFYSEPNLALTEIRHFNKYKHVIHSVYTHNDYFCLCIVIYSYEYQNENKNITIQLVIIFFSMSLLQVILFNWNDKTINNLK